MSGAERLGFGVLGVPGGRLLAVGDIKQREEHGAVYFRHILVIDFLPFIAKTVVIGIIKRDT